jgi:hypothetical protein
LLLIIRRWPASCEQGREALSTNGKEPPMFKRSLLATTMLVLALGSAAHAQLPTRPGDAQTTTAAKKPNIVVIMGDDIGWFNLGSYNSGIMLSATPNLDALATQGCG